MPYSLMCQQGDVVDLQDRLPGKGSWEVVNELVVTWGNKGGKGHIFQSVQEAWWKQGGTTQPKSERMDTADEERVPKSKDSG